MTQDNVKLIAISRVKRGGPGAVGWGLAAGIVGACQLVCGSCCWAQVAAGIYTIVIMSQAPVKAYLAATPPPNPDTIA